MSTHPTTPPTRIEFLNRIRAGLDRAAADTSIAPGTPAPFIDDSLIRLTRTTEDLPTLFAKSATATGMVVHRATPCSLTTTLRSILTSLSARSIVIDHLTSQDAHSIEAAVTGLAQIDPKTAESLDSQFDSDAGITGVLAAIAETGTLVVASDAHRSRGSFIIPPVHIALVHESQLIADMIDLWPRISSPPTALTLITGPSKTADIEGILVTGVHGPRAVHIVLIAPAGRV